MRKLFFLCCLAAIVALSAACDNSEGKTCRIIGVAPDSFMEGQWVFLVPFSNATRANVDSTVVKDGRFEFHTDTMMMAKLLTAFRLQLDVQPLLAGGTIEYEIHLPLRGANSLDFIPMGNTTTVRMHSDCATPSFGGSFLPTERDVRSDGFDAEWRVLAINRSFPQVLSKDSWHMVDDNTVGVELRRPVEQYQQNERAVKYAFLIVLLTFAVVFFVEVRRDQPIHPVQYMLIGIAVMLFYTLLLSFSEHLSFLVAYLIASAMTATMLGCYLGSIMKTWRVGMLIGGMLAVLYAFIYVLLQIESYALLVGSVGLFAVLAVAMAASRKINWYR